MSKMNAFHFLDDYYALILNSTGYVHCNNIKWFWLNVPCTDIDKFNVGNGGPEFVITGSSDGLREVPRFWTFESCKNYWAKCGVFEYRKYAT